MLLRLLPLCSLLLLCTCDRASDPTTGPDPLPPVVNVRTTLRYAATDNVPEDRQSVDVYHPESWTERQPLVVYVHGGAWVVGDKRNNIEEKAELFRDMGYVFASVNYRLVQVVGDDGQTVEGAFPAYHDDAANAVATLLDRATEFGIDRNRVVLFGHSAGAQIVSALGTNPEFLNAHGYGPGDLRGVISNDTEGHDVAARVALGSEAYVNAFGTDADDHRRASPLQNVAETENAPAWLVLYQGSVRRQNVNRAFVDALAAAGEEATGVFVPEYTHERMNREVGVAGETLVTEPIREFLREVME